MKKILLFLAAAALSVAVSAQPVQNVKLPKHDQGKTRHAITTPRAELAPALKTDAPKLADAVVTPPAGLETNGYRLNGYIFDGSSWQVVDRMLQIGFDGNDVYLQGFSVYLPEAWIKGTLNDDHTQVAFPVQYYGDLYGNDLYFFPVTPVDNDYQIIDAVFNYNERADVFFLDQEQVCYILENAHPDHVGWYYQYDSEMSITSDVGTVTVPDGLETQPYMLTGSYMGYYEDVDTWFEGDPLMGSAQVGFDGDDIYIQGLCSYLPKAWVKGHREGDNYVIDNGQFFGPFAFAGDVYPLYFMACAPESIDAEPMTLTLDPETGALVSQQWYGICADEVEVSWYDMLGNVVLTPVLDEAAVPAEPSVLYFEYYDDEDLGFLVLDIPVVDVDGKPMLTELLGYRLFCDYGNGPEPYIFWDDIYGFGADETIIPYDFNDDMNILMGGQLVVVYFIGADIQRIGVQSVYFGGDEMNLSEIGWYDLQMTDIKTITTDTKQAVEYYDLMGRRVDAAKLTPGIYVTSDGRKILIK
ncbi:MAG: hypothetical protein IKW85_08230 [Muribaculaceae bacterium]|nr:hypothetical protein [Muribaculaceae bacterium]